MYNPPKIIRNPQMPVVLIAGGAGFLGSHLAEALLSKNYRVVVVDNLETGNKNFIAHLISHPRFSFLEHNLNLGRPEKLESVDYVVHLAGEEIHLNESENVNLDSLLTNSLSTYHLLELAKGSSAKFLLSSSLNIYKGIISSVDLKNYFGDDSLEERLFSYNEAKRYAESLAWEYYKKYAVDVRVVRLPEVYGPRMDFRSTSNLGRLLHDLILGNHLTVFGDGLDKDYYLYVSDAVEGIQSALIKPKAAGKIFTLAEAHGVTQLETAYIVKAFGAPSAQIEFKPSGNSSFNPELRAGDLKNLKEIGFKPKVKLREGVKLTLESLGFSPKNGAVKEVSSQSPKLPKIPEGFFNQKIKKAKVIVSPDNQTGLWHYIKNHKKMSAFYLLAATVVFFLPFVVVPTLTSVFNLTQAYFNFLKIGRDLKNLNFDAADTASQSLSQNFATAANSLSSLPIGLKKPYVHLLNALAETSQAANNVIVAIKPEVGLISNLNSVAQESSGNTYPYLQSENSSFLLSNALDNISLAEAELKDPSLNNLPEAVKNKTSSLKDNLELGKSLVLLLRAGVTAWPDLAGYSKPRHYLVLLQNSNELRPTGGFIGAMIKLTVNGGRILPPEVEDVYNLDGLIDSQNLNIPAPKVIKDNLSTPNLHLRDANYDISFPKSAGTIRDLYQKVTGESIDGVIGVDLDFVKSIIGVLGPIYIATYNETVDAGNLFERIQFHAEAGYSPGSSSKKTFLSLLSQKVFEGLLNLKRDQYLALGKNLLTNIDERHLLADFFVTSAAGLSDFNLSGEIRNSDGDYLMIVDTNVGANKANYYINRSINYEVERGNRQGEVNSTLSIAYKHNGTSQAWPGGTYKNYLRVLVPAGASFLKAEKVDPNGNQEDITSRVVIDEEGNKESFGFLFELPPGNQTTVVFHYVLPPSVFVLNASSYNLLVQKQPGTQADPVRIKFILPFSANVESSLSQGFTRQGTSVIYEGNLKRDLELSIPLSEK
ncbi:MAG: NAD-dependent epimerase/dehydratase family protein [Patescibacteria group bacterium]|nr:NAD-dependent epimerase/dehydratase family protein [Patescibacteria group bacterium]